MPGKKRQKRHSGPKSGPTSKLNFQATYEDIVARQQLVSAAWAARNKLYQDIFGAHTYSIPADYAAPVWNLESLNHRQKKKGSDTGVALITDEEIQLSVLAYEPDVTRHYWTYVTAGIATPWLQTEPGEVSGFGAELMIKTPHRADWPDQLLRGMAFYLFNHAGTISPGVRIAINAPVTAHGDSLLRNLIVWYADEAPDSWYQLPSGGFGIFNLVGVTDDELAFAENSPEYGTWCLQQLIRNSGHGQITDPDRRSVMTQPGVDEKIQSVRGFARQFFNEGPPIILPADD